MVASLASSGFALFGTKGSTFRLEDSSRIIKLYHCPDENAYPDCAESKGGSPPAQRTQAALRPMTKLAKATTAAVLSSTKVNAASANRANGSCFSRTNAQALRP